MAPSDAVLLNDMLEDLYELGFDITWMGNNTFAIQGIPADLKQGNEVASIEKIMEDYKHFSSEISVDKREKLWRTLAKQQAIAYGKKLSVADMQELFDKLLLCEQPQLSPIGKKLFVKLSANDLSSLINNG
jgi:DNA mismatch repair protein MutL